MQLKIKRGQAAFFELLQQIVGHVRERARAERHERTLPGGFPEINFGPDTVNLRADLRRPLVLRQCHAPS